MTVNGFRYSTSFYCPIKPSNANNISDKYQTSTMYASAGIIDTKMKDALSSGFRQPINTLLHANFLTYTNS